MLELVMRAFDTRQIPSVLFQLFNQLLTVHGGYYNHFTKTINIIATVDTTAQPGCVLPNPNGFGLHFA